MIEFIDLFCNLWQQENFLAIFSERRKERAKPKDSSRKKILLHPIMLSNAFSRSAMQKMADI